MAFAALLSLENTINDPIIYSLSVTLPSALDHTCSSLRRTLGKCSQGVGDLDEQILMAAAIKLEDAIEFSLLSQPPTLSLNLLHDIHCFLETAKEREQTILNLLHDIHCFVETARERIQIIEGLWEQKKAAKMVEELFVQKLDQEEEEDVEMVGLCDQFHQIRDNVLSERPDCGRLFDGVIWISGMAGVGKTALAKKVFHDPLVKTIFQCRVFIRVGLNFGTAERILQAIKDQLNLDNGGMSQKSLLLLDDVWDPNLIDSLFRETGLRRDGRITALVTSRRNSKSSLYFHMKMRFMDEEESWELLRRKVFGEEEECPPQLMTAGKKIANKCEGLPLLINAVAPILLSKAHKNPECWNRVAHKPDSVLEEGSHQISQVLLKSYNQITEDQKMCFLYITSFPISCVVPHSTIINLWSAEGFEYYCWTCEELIGDNLLIDCQSWSEVEAFRLHCSYWYVNKRVAANNKFLYIIKSCEDDLDEGTKSHRRLAIQENVLLAIKEVHNKMASITNVRSLLCTGPYNQYQVPICWEWKLLRVLHVLTIRFYEFPVEVVKLIRLKYLALTCNANLPPSISKLWNLQFLIVHQHLNVKQAAAQSYLPVEIWYLENLIHLEITGRNLPDPPPGVVLHCLERLVDVGVESCTEGVLESLPKLKKLRIQIELAPDATQTLNCFDHISSLFYLESFQSVIVNSTLSSPRPPLSNFGVSLKKLSLSGFGYPWEDMSKIANIYNLQELKLERYAFRGKKWEAKEMRFPNLHYLWIEETDLVQWTASRNTFPKLLKLTMKNCYKLRETPRVGLADVELVDCNPVGATWAKNCHYICHVKYSWKEKEKEKEKVKSP